MDIATIFNLLLLLPHLLSPYLFHYNTLDTTHPQNKTLISDLNLNRINMKKIDEEEGTCQLAEAFAEDTKAVATWPPRAYSCSFCKREFRSAQALGGHMNVHRRDRAHLHHQSQAQTLTLAHHQPNVLGSASSVDPFINWANDVGMGVGVVNNKEMSLFYQFANNHNNGIVNNFELMSSFVNDEEMQVNEVICDRIEVNNEPIEELDLELRLGHFYGKIR